MLDSQEGLVLPLSRAEWVVFVATVYGEAANCSPAVWKGVASAILNRVKTGEWGRRGLDTVLKVISKSGFDAYSHKNEPYRHAFKILASNPEGTGTVARVAQTIHPLFTGQEETIPGIVLYYSPRAQKLLHQKNPDIWRSTRPNWNFSLLEQVVVPGAEKDDIAFFKYKATK